MRARFFLAVVVDLLCCSYIYLLYFSKSRFDINRVLITHSESNHFKRLVASIDLVVTLLPVEHTYSHAILRGKTKKKIKTKMCDG